MSIYAHRPKRHQLIQCVDADFNPTHPSTTAINGCMLIFFDEERVHHAREAVDSANIPMESFISQALETYLYATEQMYPDESPRQLPPPLLEQN